MNAEHRAYIVRTRRRCGRAGHKFLRKGHRIVSPFCRCGVEAYGKRMAARLRRETPAT